MQQEVVQFIDCSFAIKPALRVQGRRSSTVVSIAFFVSRLA
jgi:hypothetical protein